MNTVCMIGLGYIGLPTASLLATKGFSVHGMDVNEKVVTALNAGEILIHEPALDVMVKSAVGSGRLKAATTPTESDIFILAVPTPFLAGKKPDLSFVEAATRAVAPYLRHGNLLILESTSPVGTTDRICGWLKELRPDLNLPGSTDGGPQLYVAHCPERVLPGRILQELVENDRVVGGVDRASTDKAVEFYTSFVQGEVLATTARTAELVKLSENAYRDVNIAFANELSLICQEMGINVWDAIRLANRHPRVDILTPGPGVGGHCIAVDPWFIVDSAPKTARLIRTAREVNDSKPFSIIEQIQAKAARFTSPKVACLGLAFKPNIDDLRESPALFIAKELAARGFAEILAVEPHIKALPPSLSEVPNLRFTPLAAALDEADILVFLVGHRQFRAIDRTLLLGKVIIDACGLTQG
ncbi:MAG TPA: UDP-N-acetyl-D-mannosamine dehydrogenase [Humidesulfovibrio sp.]|uniref:UDP-N-acetyl-D-mannosamine dehydrogenase n=1 Tax=Humidesulfovibrio sp. TaxID=2910988 RepID=UPI002C35B3E8|nr:UDP-N-acetyl-D-mannosamine dehydrogenase [Humidesulfovibrio sp.]HWR02655.1 UDP-N-acetyl-D-mannosamine dehydrogenase [Humidesulfovibrio sp.]